VRRQHPAPVQGRQRFKGVEGFQERRGVRFTGSQDRDQRMATAELAGDDGLQAAKLTAPFQMVDGQ
jgi:hypothetical protein